jgi:hypothetical protein
VTPAEFGGFILKTASDRFARFEPQNPRRISERDVAHRRACVEVKLSCEILVVIGALVAREVLSSTPLERIF